jgi:hypothetical protein
MTAVAIAEALKVAMNILALIQSARSAGDETIPKDQFDAAVAGRNDALTKLDADIARAKSEGR